MLLDPDLKRLIFWWFRWGLENCHAFSPFLHAGFNKACMNFACYGSSPWEKGRRQLHPGRERPRRPFGRLAAKKPGSIKGDVKKKHFSLRRKGSQISDIPLPPIDCNTICCVPRNFSLHVAGRSRRHSGTCKQRGGY